MKNRIIAVAVVLILVAVGFGFFRDIGAKKSLSTKQVANKQEEAPLKVSFTKDNLESGYAIKYAEDKGFFYKEGVKVEFIEALKAPFELVVAGEADLTTGAAARPLAVFFNDVPSAVLFNVSKPFGQYAISRYDKEHAAQIKKVAVNAIDGGNQQQADLSLKNLGLDPAKVEHVSGATIESRIAMLVNGSVDIVQISDRSIYDNSEQLRSSFVLLDADITTKNSPLVRSVYAVRSVIDKKPQQLQKFTNAFYKALLDMQNNRESAVGYLKEKFSLNEVQANGTYDQFLQAVKEVNFVPQTDDFTEIIDTAKKDAINPDRNINDFVQAQFAKKALEN